MSEGKMFRCDMGQSLSVLDHYLKSIIGRLDEFRWVFKETKNSVFELEERVQWFASGSVARCMHEKYFMHEAMSSGSEEGEGC